MATQLQQQQSTISIIIQQCCEDEQSFNDFASQIIDFVSQNQLKEIKVVVDSVKRNIKNKKSDSPSKILSLRLLHLCIMNGNNEEFLQYCEKKIMKRLMESSDLEKGTELFGKGFNQRASADFLKLLLVYIQKWGSTFPTYKGNKRATEMNKLYQSLVKEHVHFPSEQSVMQSLCSDYSHEGPNNPSSTQISNMNQSYNVGGGPGGRNQRSNMLSSGLVKPGDQLVTPAGQVPPRASSPQQPKRNNQMQGVDKESQMQQVKRIKEEYKRLIEIQKSVKENESLVQLILTTQNTDESLVLDIRKKLTEDKQFSENYLNLLMNTSIIIKDKEKKIEKILNIINEVSGQLEKILIIRPYSPRALKQIEDNKKEETKEAKAKDEAPQNNERNQNINKGVFKSHRGAQNQDQQLQDQVFNQDIFKTEVQGAQNEREQLRMSIGQPFWLQGNNQEDTPSGFERNQRKLEEEEKKQKENFDFSFPAPKQQIQSPQKMEEEKKMSPIKPPPSKKDNFFVSPPQEETKINTFPKKVQQNKQFKEDYKFQDEFQSQEKKSSTNILTSPNDPFQFQSQSVKTKFGVVEHKQSIQPQIGNQDPESDYQSDYDFNSPPKNKSGQKGGMQQIIEGGGNENVPPVNDFFRFGTMDSKQEDANPFTFDFHPAPQNDLNNVDINFDFPIERKTTVEKKVVTPIKEQRVQQQQQQQQYVEQEHQPIPHSNSKKETQLQLKIDELEDQIRQLKKKNQQFQYDYEDQEEQRKILEQRCKHHEKEISQQNQLIEQLNQDKKALKRYEFLYEEEKFGRIDAQNQLTSTKTQLNEFRLSVERFEGKVRNKEMEIDRLNGELRLYDLQNREIEKKNHEIERLKEDLNLKAKREEELLQKIEGLEEEILKKQSSDKKNFKIIKQEQPIIFVRKSLVKNQYTLSSSSFKSPNSGKKRISESENEQENVVEFQENKVVGEGFSLDQFLSNNQPKTFEEKQEYVNPIQETEQTNRNEVNQMQKQNHSYEEQQANISSSESDKISRMSKNFNWDSVKKTSHFESREITPQNNKFLDQDKEEQQEKKEIVEFKDSNNIQQQDNFDNWEFINQVPQKQPDPAQEQNFGQDNNNNPFWDFTMPQKQNSYHMQTMSVASTVQKQEMEPNIREEESIQVNQGSPERSSNNELQFNISQNDKVQQEQPNPISFAEETFNNAQLEEIKEEQLEHSMQQKEEEVKIEKKDSDFLGQLLSSNIPQAVPGSQNQENIQKKGDEDPFAFLMGETSKQENLVEEKKESERDTPSLGAGINKQKSDYDPFDIFGDFKQQQEQKVNQDITKDIQPANSVPLVQTQISNPVLSQDLPFQKQMSGGPQQHFQQNISPKNQFNTALTHQQQPTFQFQKSVDNMARQSSQNAFPLIDPLQSNPSQVQVNQQQQQLPPKPPNYQSPNRQQTQISPMSLNKSPSGQQLPRKPSQGFGSPNGPQQFATYQQPPGQVQMIPQNTAIQQNQIPPPMQQQLSNQSTPRIMQSFQPQPPNQDINLNKASFTTANTQQLAHQQQQEQKGLDPSILFKNVLANFFRKSLLNNKSVIFEDGNIQIGSISEYQAGSAKIKMFFGNKNTQHPLQVVQFRQGAPPNGFHAQQNKDTIFELKNGVQDSIEVNINVETYQMAIPVYSLSYTVNKNHVQNVPIRLPVVLLKFCTAVSHLDAPSFIQGWDQDCTSSGESRQFFNLDFNQCRSLTQLKEVLQFGKNAFNFIEGVESQKNVVCGATMFNQNPIYGLIKITISGDGKNCEIVGRSNDRGDQAGKFAKFIISNILELIALRVI